MRSLRTHLSFAIALLGVMVGGSLQLASAADNTIWNTGDVFAGVGNGTYNHYNNSGNLLGFITDSNTSSFTTGCSFNNDITKLYGTDFSVSNVSVFEVPTPHSVVQTINTAVNGGASNESVVFNKAGNFYIGHADGDHSVMEFDGTGTLVATFFPQTEDRGTDWVELAADQKTLFYTSEGQHVKRFDLSTSTQLADFGALPNISYALRLLPPFDGTGGVLVANTDAVRRLDGSGNVVATYTVSGASVFFSLNLDPNGTSFWAGDLGTNLLYRFNIATGAVEIGPINTLSNGVGSQLAGVCLLGEITGGGGDHNPPVVQLSSIVTGPPKQVLISSVDIESGLGSIVVTSCNNCTATVPAFSIGTNIAVLTTATKTDQTKSSSVELKVTDVAGNTTIFDPVDMTISSTGEPSVHTLTNILSKEHLVMITNGTPGIHNLFLGVNGIQLPILFLKNGESRTIDVGFAMHLGSTNQVTITASGQVGESVSVVVTQP